MVIIAMKPYNFSIMQTQI